MTEEPRDATRREAKIIAAASAISIDYRSIVENAVSGLVHNTQVERRSVYMRARSTVRRQLEALRLPESVVELEELSLDLTIKKIEREWEAVEAATQAAAPATEQRARTVRESLTALAGAMGALGQAVAAVILILGLRPVVSALAIITRPLRGLLRGLLSPVGLAAALPIVAMGIFFVFFVDDNIAYHSLRDGPAGRWLASLDLLPNVPAPASRHKPAEQAAVAPRPVRLTETKLQPADTPVREPATDASSYRGPTRVRPVRADFAGAPAATALASVAPPAQPQQPPPPRTDSGCEGPQTPYAGCAPGRVDATLPDPASTRDGLPAWAGGYGIDRKPQARLAPPRSVPSPSDQAAAALPEAPPTAEAAAAATAKVPLQSRDGKEGAATATARPGNTKVAALIDAGKRAASKGDLDRAVQSFSEAIRIDPKFADSYSERGQALFKLGETERAIADYSAAIQRNPQQGTAFRARGMAYLYRGSTDLALTDLSRAIDLADNDPTLMTPIELFYARRSRATIYGARLQYDQEIADCTALIDSYMRDPSVAQALKEAYRDVGAGNVVAALYRQRATAHIRQSHFEPALADLTAAIPLSADGGYSALIDRSKLNETLGQRDQAIADLQNALAVRPSSEEARIALKRLGATPKPAPVRAI
jgi:tetratricopeptide (TPR) repeat protein